MGGAGTLSQTAFRALVQTPEPRETQSLLPILIALSVIAQPLLHFSFLSQGVFVLEVLAM